MFQVQLTVADCNLLLGLGRWNESQGEKEFVPLSSSVSSQRNGGRRRKPFAYLPLLFSQHFPPKKTSIPTSKVQSTSDDLGEGKKREKSGGQGVKEQKEECYLLGNGKWRRRKGGEGEFTKLFTFPFRRYAFHNHLHPARDLPLPPHILLLHVHWPQTSTCLYRETDAFPEECEQQWQNSPHVATLVEQSLIGMASFMTLTIKGVVGNTAKVKCQQRGWREGSKSSEDDEKNINHEVGLALT